MISRKEALFYNLSLKVKAINPSYQSYLGLFSNKSEEKLLHYLSHDEDLIEILEDLVQRNIQNVPEVSVKHPASNTFGSETVSISLSEINFENLKAIQDDLPNKESTSSNDHQANLFKIIRFKLSQWYSLETSEFIAEKLQKSMSDEDLNILLKDKDGLKLKAKVVVSMCDC